VLGETGYFALILIPFLSIGFLKFLLKPIFKLHFSAIVALKDYPVCAL